jgi:hypothetical protein
MTFMQSRNRIVLFVLAAVLVLSLPLAVAAQTTDAQANGFTMPKDGATVTGTVDVTGYANDAQFMKWQLDLLPFNDAAAAAFLALGETPGEFKYTLDATNLPAGEHGLRLRVVRDDSNYDEYFVKFTVGQATAAPAAAPAPATTAPAATTEPAKAPAAAPAPAAASAMTIGFTAPKDGATVSGSVEVEGYAADARFAKWQLDLLPGGDADAAAFLALGEEPGEFSYTLDTTGLPNGEHALRLRVVRDDSNYDEYFVKFTIAN